MKNVRKGKSREWSVYKDEVPTPPAAPAAPSGDPAAAGGAPTPVAPTPTPASAAPAVTPPAAPAAPAAVPPTPTPASVSAEKALADAKAEATRLANEKAELEKKLADQAKAEKEKEMSVEEKLKQLADQQAKDKAELEERLRLSNLKAFQEKALREAGSDLILDLVGGNSEEEVTASVERAKNAYKAAFEKGEAAAKAANPPAPVGKVPGATTPEAAKASEISLDSVVEMSMDDYSKPEVRKALLEKTGTMYGAE